MSRASLLFLLIAGCVPRMRLPGPIAHFAAYPDPDPLDRPSMPAAPASAGTADEEPPPLFIPESALPGRRPGVPRGAQARALEVVRASAALVDRTEMVVDGATFRHDCLGMVEAAYAGAVGLDLTSSIEGLYRQALVLGIQHGHPHPFPGDVVFFDHSYDKNGNGVRDDPFTHVAVVESVGEDGTITLIHLGGRGKPVSRKQMNLLHPDAARGPGGEVWNEPLRSPQDRDGGPDLTAQLFVGFGSFWAVSEEDLRRAEVLVRQTAVD